MKKNDIKLIIIDFYGVMTKGSYKETCQWLAKKFGGKWEDIYQIVYHKYFNQAALCRIKESRFLQAAMDELKFPITGRKLLKIHLTFQILKRPVFNLCLKLKKQGYKILLLSKNTPLQFAAVLRKMKMRKYFKYIINTFDLGLPKDSPETITFILKKFKLKPKEAVMIDDQPFNLPAAKKLGVKTILYKNFTQFKKELFKYLSL